MMMVRTRGRRWYVERNTLLNQYAVRSQRGEFNNAIVTIASLPSRELANVVAGALNGHEDEREAEGKSPLPAAKLVGRVAS
jgi:hypothetical protein